MLSLLEFHGAKRTEDRGQKKVKIKADAEVEA